MEFLARYKSKDLGFHGGWFHVLFADGHVQRLNYGLDEGVLRALFTITGGEDLEAMGFGRQ